VGAVSKSDRGGGVVPRLVVSLITTLVVVTSGGGGGGGGVRDARATRIMRGLRLGIGSSGGKLSKLTVGRFSMLRYALYER
jgi:hypothetical protein